MYSVWAGASVSVCRSEVVVVGGGGSGGQGRSRMRLNRVVLELFTFSWYPKIKFGTTNLLVVS